MNLCEAIRRANSLAKREAMLWLLLNIFSILIPIGATYLHNYTDFGIFLPLEPVSHGEISLFTISLIIAGVFVLAKGLKLVGLEENKPEKKKQLSLKEVLRNISFPGSALFIPSVVLEIVIAAVVFTNSFSQNTSLKNYQEIQNFRIYFSIGLLLICLVTTYLITLVESSISNNPLNIEKLYAEEEGKFRKGMSKGKWRIK